MNDQQRIDRLLAALEARLGLLLAKTRWSDTARFCSLSLRLPVADPSDLPDLQGTPAGLDEAFLFSARPAQGYWRLGLGRVREWRAGGAARFPELRRFFHELRGQWQIRTADAGLPAAAVFAGFAFDEIPADGPWQSWPNTLLHLPRVLLQQQDGLLSLQLSASAAALRSPGGQARQIHEWLRLCRRALVSLCADSFRAAPETEAPRIRQRRAQPEEAAWLQRIEQARKAIHAGRLGKVVPARHLHLRMSRPPRADRLLPQLAQRFPGCTQLGIGLAGGGTLLAATPERLVSLRDGRIECDALGGTLPRPRQHAAGAPDGLLQSPRLRREHALVVDQMLRVLQPLCRDLRAPRIPRVMRLRQLQHLWTPITGRVRPGVDLLQLAAGLHPTPAVAGTPVAGALDWLRQREGFARGWYTGAAGWLDCNGEGELSVILRCALLQGEAVHLYAGAGIVADSEPLAELAETDLKLASLLDVLLQEGDDGLSLPPRAAG